MLTIFSIPKPFVGPIGVIQRNAIQSWLKLDPECEIILFTNEYGTNKVAAEFGIRQIPDIERNEYGTPLINAAFDVAQLISDRQFICYVNADIIMLSDLLKAVQQVHQIHKRKDRFLIIGQRWDASC